MHEYDVTLKDILLDSAGMTLGEITGLDVTMLRDVELPEDTNPRIDLLGETGDGTLVHIELQSTNDPKMALRMLDYGLRVYKQHEKFPRPDCLVSGGERLCESGAIGNNVIALAEPERGGPPKFCRGSRRLIRRSEARLWRRL